MRYGMYLGVFKEKTLERLQGELPEFSLSDLYSNYLFARLYPEEYEVV